MSVWPTCLRQVSSAFSVTPALPHSAAATLPGALGHSCPSLRLRQLSPALSVAGAQPTGCGSLSRRHRSSLAQPSGCGNFPRRLRTRRPGPPGCGRFSRTPAGHGRFPRTCILYLEYFWPFFLSWPKSPRQRRAAVGRSARPLQTSPT